MSGIVGNRKNLEFVTATIIGFSMMANLSAQIGHYLSRVNVIMGLVLLIMCVISFGIDIHIMTAILIVVGMALINVIFIGTLSIASCIVIIFTYMPVGFYLYSETEFHGGFWTAFYLLMNIFLIAMLVKSTDPEKLFYNSSRNYVSVYLTIFMFVLVVAQTNCGRKVNIAVIVLYFLSCIISVGRGGIIASGFFLVGVLINRYRVHPLMEMKQVMQVLIIAVFFLLLGVVVLAKSDYIVETFFSRFVDTTRHGSNSQRVLIFKTYFNNLFYGRKIKNFFLGINPYHLSYLMRVLKGNLHNSLLMMHSSFGILGVAVSCLAFIKSIQTLFLEKRYEMGLII